MVKYFIFTRFIMSSKKNYVQGEGWLLKKIALEEFTEEEFDILNFYKLDKKKYPYLLESSAKGNSLARYSILFYKPNKVLIKKNQIEKINFLENFDAIWKKNQIKQSKFQDKDHKNFPFLGGWFVYLGYELVCEIEGKLKIPESPFKFPTAFASRVNSAIIFDRFSNYLFFVSDNSKEDIENMYEDFRKILDQDNTTKNNLMTNRKNSNLLFKGSAQQHKEDVKKCIKHIYDGEIFQANLSRLWEFKIDKNIDVFDIYRQLRISNPSPFGGLVDLPEGTIISSSPERLIKVHNDSLQTRPIAGTRPRGFSGLTDIELSKELISSKKERAEHLMLVDLERNDISRVCVPGSVKVDEMMIIESYAHVHHIVSNIKGIVKDEISPGKVLSAVFPGGTITGCPKVRCIEILGEIEKIGRGPYTGSFGYVCHSGDLDFNILIRSMLKENNKIFLRAGGGIVADSIPEKETLETEAKANGMLKALELLG